MRERSPEVDYENMKSGDVSWTSLISKCVCYLI